MTHAAASICASPSANRIVLKAEESGAPLRSAARQSLERLADLAREMLRRSRVRKGPIVSALETASKRTESYCAQLASDLEPAVCEFSAFGGVLAEHLRHFREREARGIAQLLADVRRAPNGSRVVQTVLTRVLLLLADLDAHELELTLIVQGKQPK